jgi:hypothetical protein
MLIPVIFMAFFNSPTNFPLRHLFHSECWIVRMAELKSLFLMESKYANSFLVVQRSRAAIPFIITIEQRHIVDIVTHAPE